MASPELMQSTQRSQNQEPKVSSLQNVNFLSAKSFKKIFSSFSGSKLDASRRTTPSDGHEFGKDMNLTAVEDPHSGSSKLSLNDLSHLDDSELNIMNSREMLAVSKKTSNSSSQQHLNSSSNSDASSSSGCGAVGRARPASVDDSIIDDSARVSLLVLFCN